MKYIKATLVFKIPKDKLTEEEQAGWPEKFEELQGEITKESEGMPGVVCTLKVEEVDE
jgi:hypothetical protein